MDKIVLDYIKEPNLFDSVAKKTAESLKMSPTQMRRFYDYLNDLLVKADEKDFSEILPFIKMLNSKAAYAYARNPEIIEFKNMIEICVAQVDSKEKLMVFKLFFEAVLGFAKR